MPGAFGSPTPMKLPSATPLPVPSVPLPTISLPSGSSINSTDYEMFNDSEELSESERVVSQQPSSSRPITPPLRNNQPPPTAPRTKRRASPPPHSDLEIEDFNHKRKWKQTEFYDFPKVTLAMGNVEAKAFIADIGTELTNQLKEELGQANITLSPATYSQAMKSEDVDKWIDVMHEEKSSLESQGV